MSYRSLQIGCGVRAQFHATAMTESDEFDLVAVCDLDGDLAAETAAAYDVPSSYTDFETAMRQENPDHVTIVLPPSANPSVVPAVLSYDPASVVMEKPVANTLDEAERIAAAASESDADVTVCHQSVFTREARALKTWLDDDRIGRPLRVVATTRGWLLSMGTHVGHLLDWLLDESPIAVRGFAAGPDWMIENPVQCVEPDSTMFELDYPDDVRAYLDVGDEAPPIDERRGTRWLETRIDVVGTEGHAEMVLTDHASCTTATGEREVVEAAGNGDWLAAHGEDPVNGVEHDWEFAYINGYATDELYRVQATTLGDESTAHLANLDSAMAVHRTFDAVLGSVVDAQSQVPGRRPPLGTSSTARLQGRLLARKPLAVSSMLYLDRPRETVLESLSELGVRNVDLWAYSPFSEHFDPGREAVEDVAAELDRHDLRAPVASIYNEEPVVEKLEFASELGADTAVMHWRPEQRDRIMEWLDAADELGMTLAFENHVDMAMESIEDVTAILDDLDHPAAGICFAPPHSWIVGDRAEEALVRLGDAIDVLYLWDVEPGADRTNAGEMYERGNSQVPGGGGAIDFERLLSTAVEHAPTAHWVVCYHGTEDWDLPRIERSIARAFRHVERSRPRQ